MLIREFQIKSFEFLISYSQDRRSTFLSGKNDAKRSLFAYLLDPDLHTSLYGQSCFDLQF